MTAQSTTFNSKKKHRHTSQTTSETASYDHVTSAAKIYENTNLEKEPISRDKATEFQKKFDFIEQIEKEMNAFELITQNYLVLSF